MKIANVALNGMNKYGVKTRDWLQDKSTDRDKRPDIVTLQKIGSAGGFPDKMFREIDYETWFLDHSKNNRGVAILIHRDFIGRRNSATPEARFRELPCDEKKESRFLTVSVGDLWISSLYAPNPDPDTRTIAWLDLLRAHIHEWGYADRESLLCGDFNVRIDDKAKRKPLRDALERLEDLGFCDLYRRAHPDREEDPGRTWGYRGEKSAEGESRLHLALASESLARRLRSARLDIEGNPWPRPDAPPLVVEFDDAGT